MVCSFSDVIFEMSFIIISVPKLKTCSTFNELSSKKKIRIIFINFDFKKSICISIIITQIYPSIKLLIKIFFIFRLHLSKILLKFLKSFLLIRIQDSSCE